MPADRRANAGPASVEVRREIRRLARKCARVAAQPEVAGVTSPNGCRRQAIQRPRSSCVMTPRARGSPSPPSIRRTRRPWKPHPGRPRVRPRPIRQAKVAIVDQGFVDQVLQGRNPIGQQVRCRAATTIPRMPIPGTGCRCREKVKGSAPPRNGTRRGTLSSGSPDTFDKVYMMNCTRTGDHAAGPRHPRIATAAGSSLRIVEVQRASGDVNSRFSGWSDSGCGSPWPCPRWR